VVHVRDRDEFEKKRLNLVFAFFVARPISGRC